MILKVWAYTFIGAVGLALLRGIYLVVREIVLDLGWMVFLELLALAAFIVGGFVAVSSVFLTP